VAHWRGGAVCHTPVSAPTKIVHENAVCGKIRRTVSKEVTLQDKSKFNAGAIIWLGSVLGRLKTRDWKTRDHLTGVENARPVAMERQSYKKSKTEIVVIVHYWKRKLQTLAQAVKNHCRKKYILMLNNDIHTQRHRTSNVSEQPPSVDNYYKHNVSCLILSY